MAHFADDSTPTLQQSKLASTRSHASLSNWVASASGTAPVMMRSRSNRPFDSSQRKMGSPASARAPRTVPGPGERYLGCLVLRTHAGVAKAGATLSQVAPTSQSPFPLEDWTKGTRRRDFECASAQDMYQPWRGGETNDAKRVGKPWDRASASWSAEQMGVCIDAATTH